MDRDGNGTIDRGSELFGNATRLSNGDRPANDLHYSRLRLWGDANHNGVSEPGELLTLQEAGVTAILTAYTETRRVDRNGNEYRYVGTVLVRRNGHDSPRQIFDVVLRVLSTKPCREAGD